MKVTVPVEVDEHIIAHNIQMAVCQGSTYWCTFLDEQAPAQPIVPGNDYTADWSYFAMHDGGSLTLLEIDEDSDDEDAGTKRTLDRAAIMRGLQQMAQHSPRQFARLMQQQGDIDTADVFLQYSLLGELIYG